MGLELRASSCISQRPTVQNPLQSQQPGCCARPECPGLWGDQHVLKKGLRAGQLVPDWFSPLHPPSMGVSAELKLQLQVDHKSFQFNISQLDPPPADIRNQAGKRMQEEEMDCRMFRRLKSQSSSLVVYGKSSCESFLLWFFLPIKFLTGWIMAWLHRGDNLRTEFQNSTGLLHVQKLRQTSHCFYLHIWFSKLIVLLIQKKQNYAKKLALSKYQQQEGQNFRSYWSATELGKFVNDIMLKLGVVEQMNDGILLEHWISICNSIQDCGIGLDLCSTSSEMARPGGFQRAHHTHDKHTGVLFRLY